MVIVVVIVSVAVVDVVVVVASDSPTPSPGKGGGWLDPRPPPTPACSRLPVQSILQWLEYSAEVHTLFCTQISMVVLVRVCVCLTS